MNSVGREGVLVGGAGNGPFEDVVDQKLLARPRKTTAS
jgi:hypothetical protein